MNYYENFTTAKLNVDKKHSDEMKAGLQTSLARFLSVLSRKKLLISVFIMLGFIILSSTVFAQAPHPGTIESRRDWVINDLANRPKYDVQSSTMGICVAKVLKNIDRQYGLDGLNHRLVSFYFIF
ncbi:MAG: hypothetical protein ACOC10_10600 [Bacteroidota bacterium]